VEGPRNIRLQKLEQKEVLKVAVARIQKKGMVARFQGAAEISNCRSLSEGLEFLAENGTSVASFTPEELSLMVKKAVKAHGVRKFVLLVDSKTDKNFMDAFVINPSIITKFWDDLLSLNATGKSGNFELCLRDTKNSRLYLNLYSDKINNFISKKNIIYAEGVNKGQKAESACFPNNGKKKNRLVDGYMIKKTKSGKSYRFSVQLKCSSNRANTNGIVKF
jgi:hypothetical protein